MGRCCSLAFSDVEHLLGERSLPEVINPTKSWKALSRTHSADSCGSTMADISVPVSFDCASGSEIAEDGLFDPGVCGFIDLHSNNALHWSVTAPNVQIAVP